MPRPCPATPADLRDVAESAVPFVSVENVGQSAEILRQAVVGRACYRVAPKRCLGRVKREVIGDEEIEVAILIEIAEGSPQAPASAADPRFFGYVGEPAALAIVSPECVSAVARHVNVRVAVGIVVSHGHALTVSLRAQLHVLRDVLELAIANDFSATHQMKDWLALFGFSGPPCAKKRSRRPSPSKSSTPDSAAGRLHRPRRARLAAFVLKREILFPEDERRQRLWQLRGRSNGVSVAARVNKKRDASRNNNCGASSCSARLPPPARPLFP